MDGRHALLQWTANSESNLAGYVVHYGVSPGVYSQQLDVGLTATPPTPASTLGPSWPTDGKWYFAVTAYNTSAQSSTNSNEVSKAIVPYGLQAARMRS